MKSSSFRIFSSSCIKLLLVGSLLFFACPAYAFAGDEQEIDVSDDLPATQVFTIGSLDDSETALEMESPTAANATAGTTITVSSGKRTDIQAALDRGKQATKSAPLTVNVTKSATLDSPLNIYSNTTLILGKDVVIKRAREFNDSNPRYTALLYGGGTNHSRGYNQFQNVTIKGGAWDGGSLNNQNVQLLSLRHGQNITISDTTFSHSTNHMINVAASKNVTISKVTFKDAIKHSTASNDSGFWNGSDRSNPDSVARRYAGIEVIHTDFDTLEGEPGDSVHDGTPAGDIVVKNCVFDNVLSGVGTHHTIADCNARKAKSDPNAKKYSGNTLTVTGCTFKNVVYRCIDAYSMDNVTASGNTVSGKVPEYFIYSKDSKNISLSGTIGTVYLSESSSVRISSATIAGTVPNAISINDSSQAIILNTKITSAGECGLRVANKSNVTMSNSTISGSKGSAVSVAEKSTVKLENNTITNAGRLGIAVDGGSTITATGNTITKPKENGIWVANSSKATLRNNTIDTAGTTGISIASAARGTIVEGNTVKNSKKWGILASNTSNLTINKNEVLQTTENGISVSSCPNVKITNNTSSSTINIPTKREIYVNAGCTGAVVTGNLYGPRGISIDKAVKNATISNNKEIGKEDDPQPKTSASWDRLYGDTALDTMTSIVNEGFKSSEYVIVATSEGYWDALAASALAGKYNAPILLTGKNALSQQTKDTIKKLGAKKALIVGGSAVVSDSCLKQIRQLCPSTERIWGDTAIDTAIAIADKVGTSRGDTCVIATSNGYWDALSASPYAFAKKAPIYLTDPDGKLSSKAIAAIKKAGYKRALIVGGPAAVNATTEQKLKSEAGITSPMRMKGDDAYQTSGAMATWALSQGLTANNVGLATANGYWDALTGAALCGAKGSVLILVGEGSGRYNINGFLAKNKASIKQAYVFGGPFAVSDSTFNAAKKAVG